MTETPNPIWDFRMVQFEDKTIYVVNYLLDDSPTGQIRGYSFKIEDFLLPE
jgi:hypothetical protein